MSILYLLIPLSLLLLGLAVWAFFWAVRSGQFDDLEGPAHRILFDDDEGDLPAARQRRRDGTSDPAPEEDDTRRGPRQGPPP
ncbi:MAG: cbb3-type cytochrome oxidase maturation protein [Halomonadaceae bacterium T82-2]|nr:MAG: cbb3-type cytochrome oxidase maturation protein [Halomonadaceae bacterium T82-2]